MRYVSIAKDFYYETTASTLSYYITCAQNGQVVYSGVANKASSAATNRINIRKRIADFLEIDMPDFRDYDGVVIPHPEQILDFELYSTDGTLLETFRALLGYYDVWDGSDVVQSEPINGRADFRQKIFWGCLSNATTGSTGDTEVEIDITYPPNVYFVCDTPIIIPSIGGVFDVAYSTNADFTFTYDGGGWFTANTDNGVLHIDAVINQSGGERIGSVCFHFATITRCFDVIQEAEAQYLTFEILSGGTIRYGAYDGANYLSIDYSTDGGDTWTVFPGSGISVSEGDIVMFKGNHNGYRTNNGYSSFKYSTAVFNLKGNLDSLIGFNRPNALANGAFAYMFMETNVVEANKLVLPLVTGEQCYLGLFYGCSMLTKAPLSIPVHIAKVSCCDRMFAGCTSLKVAPGLPATTINTNAYRYMFNGCTSLENAPVILPTKMLSTADGCYRGMFAGCTSLVNPPILSATRVGENSYAAMFENCTSLENAPDLPATSITYGSYDSMFAGCTSLEYPPVISATSQSGTSNYCFAGMFSGCTSLKSAATLNIYALGDYICFAMYSGCTSLTTAYVPKISNARALGKECFARMFQGCTSLKNAPDLNPTLGYGTTILSEYCFWYMFAGCTSLENVYPLKTGTLAKSSYCNMFNGCSSLSNITCLATNISADFALEDWMYGVSPTGTFTKKSGVSWPSGSSGIPNGWTVVEQ